SRASGGRSNAHHRDTPPEVRNNASRQVSWLTGQRFCQPSQRLGASGRIDRHSLLTVAGAAPESHKSPASLLASEPGGTEDRNNNILMSSVQGCQFVGPVIPRYVADITRTQPRRRSGGRRRGGIGRRALPASAFPACA